jgi:ribonuclease T1
MAVALVGCGPTSAPASSSSSTSSSNDGLGTVAVSELPSQARHTLDLIDAGGPFPYKQDGVVFGNRERLLPQQKNGYYHEYTVPTPGSRDRGARRIIAGAPVERYYTDDHYASFRRIVS